MSIEIKNYTQLSEGKAKGEFTVYLPKSDILIRKCKAYVTEGRTWVGLPSFPYEKDGKKMFGTYFQFFDITKQKEFLKEIAEAVEPYLKETDDNIPPDIF